MDRMLDMKGRLPELPEGFVWETKMSRLSPDEVIVKLKKSRGSLFDTVARGSADFDGNDDSYIVSKAMELKEKNFSKNF